jgi:hypothetical protein
MRRAVLIAALLATTAGLAFTSPNRRTRQPTCNATTASTNCAARPAPIRRSAPRWRARTMAGGQSSTC